MDPTDSKKKRWVADTTGCEESLAPRKVKRTELKESAAGQAMHEMWLVKVPPSLYRAWSDVGEGSDLGSLVVMPGQGGERTVHEVQLAETIATVVGGRKVQLPNYTLEGQRTVTDMMVFSQSAEGRQKGGGARIDAEVARTYNMQPQMADPQYKGLIQKRLVAATVKDKFTRPVDHIEVRTQPAKGTETGSAFDKELGLRFKAKLEQASAASTSGKRKSDEAEVKSRIFELFTDADRYTFKQLNAELRQPDDYLRSILDKYCSMYRSGPHKNTWELKKEYRNEAKEEGEEEEG